MSTRISSCPPPPCYDRGLASVPSTILAEYVSAASEVRRRSSPDILAKEPSVPDQSTGTLQGSISETSLLSLPLEIRLQVYRWVYWATPIQKPSVLPGYPSPTRKPRFTKAIEGGDEDSQCENQRSPLLLQERPWHFVPSSLMRVCKQIYAESRQIPFKHNEFVFETWFSSGLVSTAIIVLDILQPWQANSIRYARLEMRDSDLIEPDGKLNETWGRLSEAWATSLRGLRISIRFSKEALLKRQDRVKMGGCQTLSPEAWAEGFLTKMTALEQLEVEILGTFWPDSERLAWVRNVKKLLISYGLNPIVICVSV